MDKRLDCRDIGGDCDYSACSSTEQEAIRRVGEHVQKVHTMKGFSKEFYEKARAAIREGTCESELSPDKLLCRECSGVCLC